MQTNRNMNMPLTKCLNVVVDMSSHLAYAQESGHYGLPAGDSIQHLSDRDWRGSSSSFTQVEIHSVRIVPKVRGRLERDSQARVDSEASS